MNPFAWFHRSHLDDVSDEIRAHIDEHTDALMANGMSRVDAELAARKAFGHVTGEQERARDVWSFETRVANLAADVRYALRSLVTRPGYTIAVILTLALGIGANAVVFALVNAVVLRPLPYPDSERIISISQRGVEGRDNRVLDDLTYADWSQATKTASSHAAYSGGLAVLVTPRGPERIEGLGATPSYFGLFDVKPFIGRTFDASEALPGGPQVIVLSEPLWRERFGADSTLLGRSLSVDGRPRQVIGVLPAAFTVGRTERYWTPMHVAPVRDPNAEWNGFSVVARLRPGVSIATVESELATVSARIKQAGYRHGVGKPVVMTLHERRHGETRRPLLLLFGAVGVLLLTACANIANLALARAARREREFALRLALGASRWRIVRFVLMENLALALGGAFVGLLLVRASLGWFVYISPGSIQSTENIGVSGALVLYTSIVAILTALLFGMVPALTASRATPNHTLVNGTPNAAGSRRQSFVRRALVIGELAVALVFLTGAGLVSKTFWRVTRIDPGFKAEKVLIANIELGDRYKEATARAFWDAVIARVRQHPDVRSAAWARGAPMTRNGSAVAGEFRPRDGKAKPRRYRHATVEPDYFDVVGAELIAGRFLTAEDRKGAPLVAVVSEGYSAVWLEGEPALGRTIRDYKCRGNNDCDPYDITIVGIVKEMVQETSDGEQYPLVFTAMAQQLNRYGQFATLLVRTSGEMAPVQALIRDEVKALDAAQPEPRFSSMEHSLDERVAPRRFTLVLLVAFAALAGGLAIIGLYSVLAYLVTERTREIGIRVALGADRGRVMRMILGQGLRLTVVGTIIGAMLSVGAVQVLRAWMYEMSVYDAPTFVAVAVLLGIVALIASWLPARRASRVDPIRALRSD
jgi:putative ABC transport system permease protein